MVGASLGSSDASEGEEPSLALTQQGLVLYPGGSRRPDPSAGMADSRVRVLAAEQPPEWTAVPTPPSVSSGTGHGTCSYRLLQRGWSRKVHAGRAGDPWRNYSCLHGPHLEPAGRRLRQTRPREARRCAPALVNRPSTAWPACG